MSTDILIAADARSAPGPALRELATLARRLAQVTGKVAALAECEPVKTGQRAAAARKPA